MTEPQDVSELAPVDTFASDAPPTGEPPAGWDQAAHDDELAPDGGG